MLTHLSISNYAIIQNLQLDFPEGFTVMTGETGAGKSILLGALSLILGKRADTSVLNDSSKKCIVEGSFKIKENTYSSFFEANDLDFEELTILRREINSNGKSRAFINDTPVNLGTLKELTEKLIDIHSQHQTLQIQQQSFQIGVLDAFAKNHKTLAAYQEQFKKFQTVKSELDKLCQLSSQSSSDIDYITFQVEEIESLALKPNEKEQIEEELELINNAEDIKKVLECSSDVLQNSDENITQKIKDLVNQFAQIAKCSDEYNGIYERLSSLSIELDDVANEVSIHNDSFAFNPENLVYLNERISKIYSLEQKHGVNSTNEILDLLASLKLKLLSFSSYDEKIEKLKISLENEKRELIQLANSLSESRSSKIKPLEDNIKSNLAGLGMLEANFKVNQKVLNEPTEKGMDSIEFMFSANKGYQLDALHKTASGGELSRLMLTIKSILTSSNKLSTIVFDEIDTGVSGDIADKMASIMHNMSNQSQVIAITHLPQVAAKGNNHFRIYKQNKKDKTLTLVEALSNNKRVEELAKMLSGSELTNEAMRNAEVLLFQA